MSVLLSFRTGGRGEVVENLLNQNTFSDKTADSDEASAREENLLHFDLITSNSTVEI